jgi:hypothetical protein
MAKIVNFLTFTFLSPIQHQTRFSAQFKARFIAFYVSVLPFYTHKHKHATFTQNIPFLLSATRNTVSLSHTALCITARLNGSYDRPQWLGTVRFVSNLMKNWAICQAFGDWRTCISWLLREQKADSSSLLYTVGTAFCVVCVLKCWLV